MTDRELLELAAKAAGIEVKRSRLDDPMSKDLLIFANRPNFENSIFVGWNPLTDDGDALRLAVKIGEKFPCFILGTFNRSSFPHATASVVHRNGEETYIEQDDNGDLAETTRRAIVRAAAETAKEPK